jgi:hypothetical protein
VNELVERVLVVLKIRCVRYDVCEFSEVSYSVRLRIKAYEHGAMFIEFLDKLELVSVLNSVKSYWLNAPQKVLGLRRAVEAAI